MNRRSLFGFTGVAALLAVLASGCYSPDFGPHLSAVRLNVTEITLNLKDTRVITATLFPDDVDWASRIEMEWATSCGGSVIDFVGNPTEIDEDGRTSSVTIVAISPDEMASVFVRVTPGEGSLVRPRYPPYLSASSMVIVRPDEFEEEI